MRIREKMAQTIAGEDYVRLKQEEILQSFDQDLKQIGINSINFIQLVVKLENEFQVEFDVEELDPSIFITLDKLYEAVEDRRKECVSGNGSK